MLLESAGTPAACSRSSSPHEETSSPRAVNHVHGYEKRGDRIPNLRDISDRAGRHRTLVQARSMRAYSATRRPSSADQ
jgi:hypothetical protein